MTFPFGEAESGNRVGGKSPQSGKAEVDPCQREDKRSGMGLLPRPIEWMRKEDEAKS